jgi:hypothetical protein
MMPMKTTKKEEEKREEQKQKTAENAVAIFFPHKTRATRGMASGGSAAGDVRRVLLGTLDALIDEKTTGGLDVKDFAWRSQPTFVEGHFFLLAQQPDSDKPQLLEFASPEMVGRWETHKQASYAPLRTFDIVEVSNDGAKVVRIRVATGGLVQLKFGAVTTFEQAYAQVFAS